MKGAFYFCSAKYLSDEKEYVTMQSSDINSSEEWVGYGHLKGGNIGLVSLFKYGA